MNTDPKGHYAFLGLKAGASLQEVQSAIKRKQMDCHPDSPKNRKLLNSISDPDEKAKKLEELNKLGMQFNAAKAEIGDEKKKEIYDSGMGEGMGMDFGGSSIFDIFERFGGGRRREQVKKVKDTVFELKISIKESYTGKKSKLRVKRTVICTGCDGKGGDNVEHCGKCDGLGKVRVKRQQGFFVQIEERVCDGCYGSGSKIKGKSCNECKGKQYKEEQKVIEVDILPGTENKSVHKFERCGDEKLGCIPGDLIIVIMVAEDPNYIRIGNDIISSVEIDIFTILTGGSVYFTHLDDRKLEIKLNKFTNLNDSICVEGEGFLNADLYLHPKVHINNTIDTEKLKQILPPILPVPFKTADKTIQGRFKDVPEHQNAHEDEREQEGFSFFSGFGF
ncbi:Mitochondrial-type Hsp40 [Spraguea lophii 42_110]|uniref:Mitochondrial-type Hsp40 n=1 Tax=Spraguea lophii (strain 42_110) TaxID=1358809 RepID=S7XTH1_SPRLO|nr:Mitochondrial-type Hsp40 [Spraguea lophii 42_110]